MIKNWPAVFARFSRFNFRFVTRGRFWANAARLLAKCAPPDFANIDGKASNRTIFLSGSPLGQQPSPAHGPRIPDFSFPLNAYRAAMDCGIAAKASWAHRCKMGPPGGPGVEILVFHR